MCFAFSVKLFGPNYRHVKNSRFIEYASRIFRRNNNSVNWRFTNKQPVDRPIKMFRARRAALTDLTLDHCMWIAGSRGNGDSANTREGWSARQNFRFARWRMMPTGVYAYPLVQAYILFASRALTRIIP